MLKKYLDGLMCKIEKAYAKFVIFLIGGKIELWLYQGRGDRGEKTVGIVEQYSGMYYGIWEIKTRGDWAVEAVFRGFDQPQTDKRKKGGTQGASPRFVPSQNPPKPR